MEVTAWFKAAVWVALAVSLLQIDEDGAFSAKTRAQAADRVGGRPRFGLVRTVVVNVAILILLVIVTVVAVPALLQLVIVPVAP